MCGSWSVYGNWHHNLRYTFSMDQAARQKLTELIEEAGGKNWWVPEAFSEQILPRLPAELTIICLPPAHTENYNCFVFAFGLEEDPYFLGGDNPIQQEFVKYLISKGVFNVTESPEPEDLVFYRDDDDNLTHGGVLKSKDIVLSKWMWGPTFENKLWDVPASFGDDVFYVKPVAAEHIKLEYELYKNSGVKIKPIS